MKYIFFLSLLLSSCDKITNNSQSDYILTVKPYTYKYSEEIFDNFDVIPLNILVTISRSKNDTTIVKYSRVIEPFFKMHQINKKIYFNEKINKVNYYYINENSTIVLPEKKVLAFNSDSVNRDIYYYANKITIVGEKVFEKKNIESSEIKWSNPLPPPRPIK